MAEPTFEAALARLEDIVRRLESQDLDLDESLRLFEEGVERLRAVRDRLAGAEAKVKQLLGDRD
jgi:exodeoxyribonuclease VII small subunit